MANLDSSAGQAYYYGSAQAEDLMKIKASLQETERELQDLQSNYDRDKALWEGKVMFLETQKDNYKKDLVESQRKFELTLEQLQKRGSHDKEKNENNQQAMIKVIEGKYKAQIKDMMETHQALNVDSKGKVRRLESELAAITEKLNAATQNRQEDIGQLEKKLLEAQSNETRLASELEEVKNEKNRRITEYQSQIEKEKENYKQRITEAEKKAKEAESRRAQLLFSVEKERANWVLEEEHSRRKQTELEEFIARLEQSKENLKKENERLRYDMKSAQGASGPARKQFMFAKPSSNTNISSAGSTGSNKYLIARSGTLG